MNPQFKVNYHDKSKNLPRDLISRSHDVYEKRLVSLPASLGMKYIDKFGQEQLIANRGVSLAGIPEEISVQEKIKLINQKNAKLPKIGIKQGLHNPIFDKYKDALPQLQLAKPIYQIPKTQVKSPIVVSRSPANLVSKNQQKLFINSPEWWG